VAALVADQVPADAGPGAEANVRARTTILMGSPGLPAVLRTLPGDVPVRDREGLRAVTAEVLVVAQEENLLHPADVAQEVAGLLPPARLGLLDRPGALFHSRRRVRQTLVDALDGAQNHRELTVRAG